MLFFFFFKQKTAYEIKECAWSSDVCSSDLAADAALGWDDVAIDAADPTVGLRREMEAAFAPARPRG